MIRSALLSSIALLSAVVSSAQADLLFERTVVIDRSANIFTSTDFDLDIVLLDDFLAPTNTITLFDGLSITPSSVGATYTAAVADAEFSDVADKLSDGQDEIVNFVLSELSTGRSEERGFNERNFFFASNPILPPDLAGNQITSISIRVDEFTLDFGSVPGGATATPPVNVGLTISVHGVPEPQTWALAGTAVCMLIFVSWNSRRRLRPAYARATRRR